MMECVIVLFDLDVYVPSTILEKNGGKHGVVALGGSDKIWTVFLS